MLRLSTVIAALSLGSALSSAYLWPNPRLDELERLLYDQKGYKSGGSLFMAGLTPCDRFFGGLFPGRSNAADWVRTAYHDMVTFNVEDGTGGLDGSIRFAEEQSRPENVGDGFDNTFRFFVRGFNRDASVADVVALGAVMAVEQCGGPKIPYRGGRIDATKPNNPGVPEQQSLADHTASFAKQGFTQMEMIGLVACGHSFGGVQHSAFPDLVPAGPDPNEDVQATFDTSPNGFDNRVATEYIDQSTTNPLVAGHNITTNSDARIFSSDGNVTMKSFADSPELFASTCSRLLAKMIDTVPAGVLLSDPIDPLPVKPSNIDLQYFGDGTLELRGEVRFWAMPENLDRKVTLRWADRQGIPCSACTAQLTHTTGQVSTAHSGADYSALWYSLPTGASAPLVNATAGISKFWFEVSEGTGAAAKAEDQGGIGFVIEDGVVVRNTTCLDTKNNFQLRVDIAIRKDIGAIRVYVESDALDTNMTPLVNVVEAPAPTTPSAGEWDFRTVGLGGGTRLNVAADAAGKTLRTAYFANSDFRQCP